MPRYRYLKLRVMCLEPRDFSIGELRAAVEYLRAVPGADTAKHVGLVAIAATVPAGNFKLDPQPMLRLPEILGRTPAEVWKAFDADIDKQRSGLTHHGASL